MRRFVRCIMDLESFKIYDENRKFGSFDLIIN